MIVLFGMCDVRYLVKKVLQHFKKIIKKRNQMKKKKNRASLNNCSRDVDSVSRYATSAVLVSLIRRAVASMGQDEAIASS